MPEPFPDNPLGRPFVELDSIDSTNNYALARIHAGMASHGEAFFAWEQYAGKGQRGRVWQSEKGNNLIISIIIDPKPLAVQQQFQLSACLSVSVATWFTRLAGDATRIKWPNDLYWHDRKAGGILIESIIANSNQGAQWKWAVAGIGININQVEFNSELKNPVSLRQITGKSFAANELAHELCTEFEKNWQFIKNGGFPQMLTQYNELLFRKQQEVKLRQGSRSFTATLLRVDEHGKLWVWEGVEREYSFGEIEFLL
ncbi:MAG: biotin--[acetyl-CoA-carboxylase] ligase [Chitinophagaceae bacterium]|nr:biotin--[acetyl-CoA-carboxylase] ligase [Chitinophagaceae bacterium]